MPDAFTHFYINPGELTTNYSLFLDLRETCMNLWRQTQNDAWLMVGQKVAKVQTEFAGTVNRIAQATAVEADRLMKMDLKAKIVRPPTGNRPGLEDSIVSVAPLGGQIATGLVEVALVDKLEGALGTGGAAYWRTQEFGYTGNVGRTIQGVFTGAGGSAPPDPTLFRQHPVFMPGAGGKGTIGRPIPAKHFLRDGSDAALVLYHAMLKDAVAAAVAELNGIALPGMP